MLIRIIGFEILKKYKVKDIVYLPVHHLLDRHLALVSFLN